MLRVIRVGPASRIGLVSQHSLVGQIPVSNITGSMTGQESMRAEQVVNIGSRESLSKVAGLNIRSDLSLKWLPTGHERPDVVLVLREGEAGVPHILQPLIMRKDSEGEEILAHFLTTSGYYLRYGSVEFVIEFGEKTIVYCYPGYTSPETIWGIFVSDVLPYVLEERRIDVMHSSAVVMDGSGIAFVGYPGSGKSTLAAYLLKEGYPLLADDRLPLAISEDKVWAIPNFPGIRISEDAAKLFFGRMAEELPRVHSKSEKRFLYFGTNGNQASEKLEQKESEKSLLSEFCLRFQTEPVPLERIYILKPDSDGIDISPLSPKDAFFNLIPHIFDSRKPVEALFDDKCALARLVQVHSLSLPRSFHVLPDVVESIKL
jgi:hypothetical protein